MGCGSSSRDGMGGKAMCDSVLVAGKAGKAAFGMFLLRLFSVAFQITAVHGHERNEVGRWAEDGAEPPKQSIASTVKGRQTAAIPKSDARCGG